MKSQLNTRAAAPWPRGPRQTWYAWSARQAFLTSALATIAMLCLPVADADASDRVPGEAALSQPKQKPRAIVMPPRRTNNRSPQFFVTEDDVDFFMNYSGFTYTNRAAGLGERFLHAEIAAKAAEMITAADEYVVASVFLFDNLYAELDTDVDVVKMFTDLLLAKRKEHPDMTIAIVFDPMHRAYGQRISEAERRFEAHGIDVFYSDMISDLKAAAFLGVREGLGHISMGVDHVTFGGWGWLQAAIASRVPLPGKLDDTQVTVEMVSNALLLKANHRKLLVTDSVDEGFETLITSANPHNASFAAVNTAISVKGELARYVYMVLREDIRQSIRLGGNKVRWSAAADRDYRKAYLSARLPELVIDPGAATRRTGDRHVGVTFVTEAQIAPSVIGMLGAVEPEDDVRIQMFFLSYKPVVDAILEASRVVRRPVRLLLDANKDSFNAKKDGTPNRQVAKHMRTWAKKHGGKLDIRWYATHGEQNHAKIMSITNRGTGKALVTTGSCNWTGRNMAGVNMESNLNVDGSRKLSTAFNKNFDLFWTNSDGNEYSLDYSAFDEPAANWKWHLGEAPFYWSVF